MVIVCGRYEFEPSAASKLGSGNYGDVYVAQDLHDPARPVCVKVIPGGTAWQKILGKPQQLQKADLDSIIANARVECDLLRRLPHCDNLVQTYDFETSDRAVYVVMERLENSRDLCDYVCRTGAQSFSEDQLRTIIKQAVVGLRALHSFHVAHLDLKPDNILIRMDSESASPLVKLVDFGLSRVVLPVSRITNFAGTFEYMDPQMVRRRPCGYEADVWSLAATMFAVCTASFLPFSKQSFIAGISEEDVRRTTPRMMEMMRRYSPELKDLFFKMLVVNPLARITVDGILQHSWFTSHEVSSAVSLQLLTEFNRRRHLKLSESSLWYTVLKSVRDSSAATVNPAPFMATLSGDDEVNLADLTAMSAEHGLDPVFHVFSRKKEAVSFEASRTLLNLTLPTVEARQFWLAYIAVKRLDNISYVFEEYLQEPDSSHGAMTIVLLCQLLLRIVNERSLESYVSSKQSLISCLIRLTEQDFLRSGSDNRRVSYDSASDFMVGKAAFRVIVNANSLADSTTPPSPNFTTLIWLYPALCDANPVEYAEGISFMTSFSHNEGLLGQLVSSVFAALSRFGKVLRVMTDFGLAGNLQSLYFRLGVVSEISTRFRQLCMSVVDRARNGDVSALQTSGNVLALLVRFISVCCSDVSVDPAFVASFVENERFGYLLELVLPYANVDPNVEFEVRSAMANLNGSVKLFYKEWSFEECFFSSSAALRFVSEIGVIKSDAFDLQSIVLSHSIHAGCGKMYFEVRLVNSIEFSVGWTAMPLDFIDEGSHVGKSSAALSVGLMKDRRIHQTGQRSVSTTFSQLIPSTVIGCGVDTDAGTFSVWINESQCHTISLQSVTVGNGPTRSWSSFAPAISLSPGQMLEIRVGSKVQQCPRGYLPIFD
eukprot:ANDGO_06493.mRNA.1 putative serine/threonine-protein kinase MARK-A